MVDEEQKSGRHKEKIKTRGTALIVTLTATRSQHITIFPDGRKDSVSSIRHSEPHRSRQNEVYNEIYPGGYYLKQKRRQVFL